MPDKVYIRQNDTLPYLDYTLVKDSLNTPHNLITGTTVKFTMTNRQTGVNKISEAVMTIVSAVNGQVRYSWESGDTDTIGEYDGEIEVTFLDNRILSFPEGGYIRIVIVKELA